MNTDPGNLVRQLVEAWNAHDVESVVALYADDFVGVDVAEREPQRGPSSMRASYEQYVQAFPDLVLTLHETIVQDDRVAVVWTVRGTHNGSILRIPATARAVEVRGMSAFTVRDGKFVAATSIWDLAGLLRSLGLLPDL
jgi:steroid delta-isomerase-like uncharacterized protein